MPLLRHAVTGSLVQFPPNCGPGPPPHPHSRPRPDRRRLARDFRAPIAFRSGDNSCHDCWQRPCWRARCICRPAAELCRAMTLEQAIQRAAEGAPRLQAGEAAVDAARAGRVAGRRAPQSHCHRDRRESCRKRALQCPLPARDHRELCPDARTRRQARGAHGLCRQRDIGVAEASARVARLDLAAQVERPISTS